MRRSPAGVVLGIAGVAAVAAWGLSCQSPRGRGEPGAQDRRLKEAIADVAAGRRTTPLIGDPGPTGDVTVTFLARRSGGLAPRIVSDVTGWGEHIDGTFDFTAGTMALVGETGWAFLQTSVAAGARIEYRIAYGQTDYRFDPHNPRRSAGPTTGGAEASEFVTPGHVPPPEFDGPAPAVAGSVSEAEVERACRTLVYTPPGGTGTAGLPTAVFLDLRAGPISRVLDWLIARREIPPVIATFVGPRSHGDDRCSGEVVRRFVTGRLPRWLVTHRGASPRPEQRVVLAISYGAKDALEMALDGRAVFGGLGLLLPGRRITPEDIAALGKRPVPPFRVAILAGRYDQANLPTARGLRDALSTAGHAVEYVEVPEGHSAVTWRNHLRAVLIRLFRRAASAKSGTRG